jgi:hypothetical protein
MMTADDLAEFGMREIKECRCGHAYPTNYGNEVSTAAGVEWRCLDCLNPNQVNTTTATKETT